MARPRKQTVEYFSHDCDHGKTMFIIEQKFGNDGYAFWFKILELLGKSDGHFLNLNNGADWEFLTSVTRLSDVSCVGLLDLLAKLEAIDAELWESKIVWSQNFVDRLGDAYRNRTLEIPLKPSFLRKKPLSAGISDDGNPQMKLNEMKLNEMKDTDTPEPIFPESKKPAQQRFKIPILDEVTQYCQERKNNISPQLWLDHYTANGWMVGKNKMRDWQAAIRTWEKSSADYNQNKRQRGTVTL